jgi:D-3-phosphoglycerate dehydrogenase
MARMAGQGFRMRVLGFDPNVDHETMRAAGVEKSDDLKVMLRQCDFVSLHCVLNVETHHLIGADELACLKSSAMLVNVSRGALIDEAALVDAVLRGRLGGVALDVFSDEPLGKTDHVMSPLYGRDDVILFPHLTFFTHEAMQRLEADTLARCLELIEGRPVTVRSNDPRLRAQTSGVVFG